MKGRKYYCASRKKWIFIKICVLAALADRPEKAFVLKICLLGTYGKIASWAASFDPDQLSDCKQCFRKRIEKTLLDRYSKVDLGLCRHCAQWDLESESPSMACNHVPEHYPRIQADGSPDAPKGRSTFETQIDPIKQTFEFLRMAVLFAAFNVAAGVWTKTTMNVYLRTCSVAKTVRDYVWQVSKSQNAITTLEEIIEEDGEVSDGFQPKTNEMYIAPYIWYSKLVMSSYVDCGMHLVFHGVLAYTVEVMERFITDHKLSNQFLDLVNDYLDDIEGHRLEWCKVKTFPKKQWLGENELGLARLLPFVYGMFFENISLPDNTNTSEQSVTGAKQMLHSLHVLICILMSTDDPNDTEILNHVKVFLSCCHRFARCYWDKSVEPFWSKTGNFPTLLCLADQRKRHGPVRWYWEGTSERFIQQLKKVLESMQRSQNYFARKLSVMHRRTAFRWIRDNISETTEENASDTGTTRNYYQYGSIDEIKRRLKAGCPLSGFTIPGWGDGVVLVAFGENRRSGKMHVAGIQMNHETQQKKLLGAVYCECELDEEEFWMMDKDVESVEQIITSYCLMLPLVGRGKFTGEFTYVYSDWDVNGEDLKKRLPYLCRMIFACDIMN